MLERFESRPLTLHRFHAARAIHGITLAILAWMGTGGGSPVFSRAAERPDVRRDATVVTVEKALPAVVNIGTVTVERSDPYDQVLRDFFGYGRRAPDTVYSSGSGVVIDEEGWVLTNFHVIRGAQKVQVTIANGGDTLDAEVVSVSEVNDLALLRIRNAGGRKFTSVPLAADDDLLLGETVIALGNPYGLGESVSRGILSSKTRRPERDGEEMQPEDWLQTDASINPGNSGGPLVNLRGELIGLNVAILARAQGIGFAIPVKRISAALAEMVSPEATAGRWFGASVRGSRAPLRVASVQPGSPADTAGLRSGDDVVAVNGTPVQSPLQFYRLLRSGSSDVRLGVMRDGRRRDLAVSMLAEATVFNLEYLRRRLGLTLERVPEDIGRQLGVDLSSALMIGGVERGGPAAEVGLVRGQLLTAIDGQAPGDVIAVGRLLHRKPAGKNVVVSILSARRRGMLLRVSEGRAEIRLR